MGMLTVPGERLPHGDTSGIGIYWFGAARAGGSGSRVPLAQLTLFQVTRVTGYASVSVRAGCH